MDLLLCSGESDLSNKIKWFQRLTGWPVPDNELSHLACCYKTTKTGLSVIESTTLNKWCNKSGVQMNPFDDWLNNYNGRVWVKQLTFDRKPYNKQILNYWLEHRNDPYENGIMGGLELFLCGLGLHKIIQKVIPSYKPLQTKNPHCTELIAELFKELSFFNRGVETNRMPPALWWEEINSWFNIGYAYKNIRIK